MPNPRFLKTAERWKNKEVPSERVQPVTPVQQSPPLMNNVSYSFLEGTEGQAIFEEYNQRASGDYQGASALSVLSFSDNVLKGSNPFAFALLNKILAQKKMRMVTPADLERALEKEAINLKGTYGDSGLVLRSDGDPNQYLARDLINQIKQRGSLQFPLMIPLAGLGLVYDSNSPNDLSFQLTDSSEIIYAPQLNKTNHGKKFNKGDEQGRPIFEDSGTRTLYSNGDGGLCRLYRDRDLDLGARGRVLADSYGSGRVIICAGGTSPKN
jgi:hypothetical protein